MQVEHRIHVQASPDKIFQIYERVSEWHIWDPDTRQASLRGPFLVGSCGKLIPTRGRPVPMMLTQVQKNKLFTVESRIPLFSMVFEHELVSKDAGTEVVHRVTLAGALSLLLGRMLIRQLNAGLPVTLARLKTLAETGKV